MNDKTLRTVNFSASLLCSIVSLGIAQLYDRDSAGHYSCLFIMFIFIGLAVVSGMRMSEKSNV